MSAAFLENTPVQRGSSKAERESISFWVNSTLAGHIEMQIGPGYALLTRIQTDALIAQLQQYLEEKP
jgi:hypothetical protein